MGNSQSCPSPLSRGERLFPPSDQAETVEAGPGRKIRGLPGLERRPADAARRRRPPQAARFISRTHWYTELKRLRAGGLGVPGRRPLSLNSENSANCNCVPGRIAITVEPCTWFSFRRFGRGRRPAPGPPKRRKPPAAGHCGGSLSRDLSVEMKTLAVRPF